MPSDPQSKQTLPKLRIVPPTRATRVFRRLLRIAVNGLLACINRRHPKAKDFDEIEVTGEEYIVEELENGEVTHRETIHRKKYIVPTFFIVSLISTIVYYILR